MVSITIFVIVVVAVVVYFWWYGNSKNSPWGKLVNEFPGSECLMNTELAERRSERVGLFVGDKWVTGCNATYIVISEIGLCLIPEAILRWAMPPIFVPWAKVNKIGERKSGLFMWIELPIDDAGISILLPVGYLAKCRNYIKEKR